jgi:hypothetical protein
MNAEATQIVYKKELYLTKYIVELAISCKSRRYEYIFLKPYLSCKVDQNILESPLHTLPIAPAIVRI